MKKIFLIGGLGADERVFQHISLYPFEQIFVQWLPSFRNEPLADYAKRLATQFILENDPIIVGVSFGGMLATEIAKLKPKAKVFIVSSAKTFKEIPVYFRILGYLNILKFTPIQLFKYHTKITDWFFGVKNKQESLLLESILQNTDGLFLKWALNQIVHWENTIVPSNVFHIHGNKDRILPSKFVNPTITIAGGGHLMILNKALEISKIIEHQI